PDSPSPAGFPDLRRPRLSATLSPLKLRISKAARRGRETAEDHETSQPFQGAAQPRPLRPMSFADEGICS
ncbi:MAG: hypothetical protein ACRCS0_02875, partial [Albidovulum sp.]